VNNNLSARTIIVFVFAGIICTSMSCKTKRILTSEESIYKIDSPDNFSEWKTVSKGKYETLKIKRINGSSRINGDTQSFKTNVAVYRDSLIAISVIPALGYELFRFMCTKDSVIVINRHDKNYIASSIEKYSLKNGIPINFEDLQSILLNEVFIYQGNIQDRKYVESISEDNAIKVYRIESFIEDEKLTNQSLRVNHDISRPVQNLIDDYNNKFHLKIGYNDFNSEGGYYFPKTMKLSMQDKDNYIDLNLDFGVIEFNETISVDFTVPANYLWVE
jgi:hypothetical protein